MRIRVPATSANLGAGFDALGLALGLHNYYEVTAREGLAVTGCPEELAGPDNLFLTSFRRGLEVLGLPWRGLGLHVESSIPIARGLGSSAACIVGGLLAASCLRGRAGPRGELGEEGILDLAAAIEGHPDNVAPALLGGFCVAVAKDGRVHVVRSEVTHGLVFNALVPPFALSTAVARAALPASLPFADAVFNIGRAALTAAAFTSGDWRSLSVACEDRLHEPYRSPLVPDFDAVVSAARAAGAVAVYLSGAGPTVMAMEDGPGPIAAGELDGLLAGMDSGSWRRFSLSADNQGAALEAGDGR
jgi:homoserine kinase